MKTRQRANPSLSPAVLIASGLGLGYLPLAPGTWASLATALIWFWVFASWPEQAIVVHRVTFVLAFPVAWITAGRAVHVLGEKDPSKVVIDEIVGQSIPFFLVASGAFWVLLSFALFRLFDIVKPPPVRQCENLPGGLGILMDDCAAGVYAGLLVWLIHAS